MMDRTALAAAALLACSVLSAQAPTTLVNPLLPSGADPWVTSRNGFYYYMNTTGSNLTIWKTRSMADLAAAEKKVVWRPPAIGPYLGFGERRGGSAGRRMADEGQGGGRVRSLGHRRHGIGGGFASVYDLV